MQMAQEKVHPMTVVTIANARVHDLIGLICWQYTSEGREPKLKWAQTHFIFFLFRIVVLNSLTKKAGDYIFHIILKCTQM